MGHPRDMCHAVSYDGSCTYNGYSPSVVGDGNWDRDLYFRINFPAWTTAAQWQAGTGLPANATRYQVYQWEKADRANRLGQKSVGAFKSDSTAVCRTEQSASAPDRRRFTMAVVNCKSQAGKINGNQAVDILKWVDVFLVEPAFDRGSGANKRTTGDQVYVEVIGDTTLGGGGATGAQLIRRDVPYLVH